MTSVDLKDVTRRPAIPAEIVREVLIECGHRCAACGTGCPLERAHIVPWCQSQNHALENLLCLCANCHARADLEKWGSATLREYKRRPWVLRQFAAGPGQPTAHLARVRLTIDMELSEFDERYKRLLQHALAAFLEVSPELIQVSKIEEGSVKVTIALPPKLAEDLVTSYNERNPELLSYLDPFPVHDMRQIVHRDLVVLLSSILSIPVELINEEIEEGRRVGIELDSLVSLELWRRLEERLGISIEPQELRTLADAFKLSYLVERVSEERSVTEEDRLLSAMLDRLGEEELEQLLGVEDIDRETT